MSRRHRWAVDPMLEGEDPMLEGEDTSFSLRPVGVWARLRFAVPSGLSACLL